MTTNRQLAANRRNAQRSTGPRSVAGKARSRRNALRHGLATSLARHPGKSLHIERLARALAGEDPSPAQLYNARIAAEAELDILRVRAARVALINHLAQDRLTFAPLTNKLNWTYRHMARLLPHSELVAAMEGRWRMLRPPIPENAERVIAAFGRAVPDLAKFDRYERRALSRRKRALRALDSMRDAAKPAATR